MAIDPHRLKPSELCRLLNSTPLTMFIDVQQNLLFYSVCAWDDAFAGYVLDYGTYPDQQLPYFTLRDARRTLGLAEPGTGLEGANRGATGR